MIYRLISRPLHRSLSLPQAVTACIVFTAFVLVCSLAKERLTDWYRLQRTAAASV